jgi:hypothetical protein
VTGFMVNGGDLLAFAGVGPYYPQQPNDVPHSDATYYNPAQYSPPGGLGSVFTVGDNGDTNATYQYIGDDFGNQGRAYAIGVDVAETNLFLPVYHISQNGATAAQARYLADALNIPPNLLVQSNGLVGFIDPSNFMVVPTVPVTDLVVISNLLADTKQPAGSIPISFRAIDFGALSNRPVLGTNAALNLASGALAAAGLTPQFGTPVIGHTVFTAFCTNGDGTVSSTHQYLDSQVNYQFTDAAGFPLIGPGAQAQLAFDPQGETTRFLYSCRQLAPGPTVEVISPLEASNRVVHLLPPNARVNLQLVYWAPPFWPPTPPCYECPPINWSPNEILPFYAFNGTVTEINPATGAQRLDTTEVRLIPATDDIDYVPSVSLAAYGTNQVVAVAYAYGGRPPYSYSWSGSDPAIGTNTTASISFTPRIRIAAPVLSVSHDPFSDVVSVSWPASAAGYVLEATSDLLSGQWSRVSGQVINVNGANQVAVPATGRLFFRLHQVSATLPANESLSVSITDANGITVATNLMIPVQAQPIFAGGTIGGTSPVTWGTEDPYDGGGWVTDQTGWQNVMGNPLLGGGQQSFCWTKYLSWPGDFAEPSPAGTLQPIFPSPAASGPTAYDDADFLNWGVNGANMVMYMGHGNTTAISFTWPDYTPMNGQAAYGMWLNDAGVNMDDTYYTDTSSYTYNLHHSWGNIGPNDYLYWLGFSSCLVLQYNSNDASDSSAPVPGGQYAWNRWGDAFNGLHIMLGYQTEMIYGIGTPGTFAQNTLGLTFFGIPWIAPQSIMQAWFNAALAIQPISEGYGYPAAMGQLGPGGVCDSGDYYPGKGSMGPTIAPAQRTGWWYMNESTGMVEVW